MTAEEFADKLSMRVREIRLRRIGEDPNQPCVAFVELPVDEQQNWIDVAEAASRIFAEERRSEIASTDIS